MKNPLTGTLVVLWLFTIWNARAQFAHLTLQSQPGDYIGQGQNHDVTYTPDNSAFFSASVRRTLPSGEPAELVFALGLGPNAPFALLFFGTDQLGIPIQPGFYADAQRADFAAPGHPGLDVGFDHRGCNMVAGSFTIADVTFGPGNSVQTFAATFEQHCEGGPAALFGSFTFTAVPEPAPWILGGLAAVAVLGSGLLRKRSS